VSEQLVITEVGPRDGLQNQSKTLTAEQRLMLIAQLRQAGLVDIEVGSFVSPKAVPAMAATGDVVAGLSPDRAVNYSVLVPNMRGYEMAVAAGVKQINLVIAASDTFNQNNIRMSTGEALAACMAMVERSLSDGVNVVPYIATAWACPFEGDIANAEVLALADPLLAAGAKRLVVADTIGAATPDRVAGLVQVLVQQYGQGRIGCHFHDTRGFALANVYAAFEQGIRHFDSAIGGLGGCPFAPGATGNVATEDVVLLFEQMGVATGIDLAQLLACVELAEQLTGHCEGGRAVRWLKRQRDKGLL
jgi:hydroxymethylglutaryl-CoA lyase